MACIGRELVRESKLGIIPVSEFIPEYSGSWTISRDYRFLTGIETFSGTTNDYIQLTFQGRKIGVIFSKASNKGIAGISIDGGSEETIDLYNASYLDYIWYKDGLSDAEHTIKIRVTGTKNASSADYYVPVEGFLVEIEKNPNAISYDHFIRYTIDSINTSLSNIWSNKDNPVSAISTSLDETSAQSLSLDTYGRKTLEVYGTASTATTFYVDVSPNNSYWINIYTSSAAETSHHGQYTIGFRYARIRSAAAGAAGDTVDLVIGAKT